jgi:hypothetical protein
MDFKDPLLLAILGVAVLAVGYWVVTHFFSEEARWERRRRRSNTPITNKSNRPSVKLSVRTKKERRK